MEVIHFERHVLLLKKEIFIAGNRVGGTFSRVRLTGPPVHPEIGVASPKDFSGKSPNLTTRMIVVTSLWFSLPDVKLKTAPTITRVSRRGQ